MRFILTIFILFACTCSKAQLNIVRNPSLESYSLCPDGWDEINYANYWRSLDSSWSPPDWAHDLNGVPEYCNICSTYPRASAPYNVYFYHYPRTGGGMAQVQMFYNDVDTTMSYKRDYLQGYLASTLIAGRSYCVTFYVTLEQGSLFAINHIGAYLDDGTIDTTHNPDLPQVQFTPQIIDASIVYDTLNWVKVQGSFIANGSERLITIGNFSDTRHTAYAPAPGMDTTGSYTGYSYSWYLVDDVSVISSESVADAGPDKSIALGDSVLIGTNDGYLPTYWYANGTLIDSNTAGLYVHPTGTTRYVMALDVCGTITYDTMVVWVNTEQVNNARQLANIQLYPNPAQNELTLEHAKGARFILYDIVGQVVVNSMVSADKQELSIAALPAGVYIAEILSESGEKRNIRVIKQ